MLLETMALALGITLVVLSIILHEIAHGFIADKLGDPTARLAGRLTLNPFVHIDPIGSVALPGILALTHSPFLLGWAKPVPYNPYNLNARKWGLPLQFGEALVGIAGPLTNVLLAVLFGSLLRYSGDLGLSATLVDALVLATMANLVLAIFNLIPLPPLDGSKVLSSVLPTGMRLMYQRFEQRMYSFGPLGLLMVGLIAIYLLWPILSKFVFFLFALIVAG